MDNVKEAFSKVKEDMDSLKNQISFLNKGLIETRESLVELCNLFKDFSKKKEIKDDLDTSTLRHINSTNSTYTSTDSTHIKPLEPKIPSISIGNEGVPTDRQTDRQTDKLGVESSYNSQDAHNLFPNSLPSKNSNSLDNAMEFLDSLDTLKKEIRIKFKRLTDQEMLVFSTLYQFSEENAFSDYKSLANKLNLTESSIRDYVGRLIKKGIPIEKNKVNNKTIQLSISQNLKKIASLQTILQLREI